MSPSQKLPLIARMPLIGTLRSVVRTDARWAKILEIKRAGRVAQILLEVHESDLPPFEHWTRTLIPFGRNPKVGDEVYWVDRTVRDSNVRAIAIRWRKAPNYGSAAPTNEELKQAFLTPFASNPVFAAGAAAAGDPLRQLELLQQLRADGKLSERAVQHDKEDLLAWAADPAGENDPAAHRRRLDKRRAAGEVTDAQYAQRAGELDAWEQGLARVRSTGDQP